MRRQLLACLVNAAQCWRSATSPGPLRFALLLLLVDRHRDIAAIIARAVWPERDWLAARYGRAGLGVRCATCRAVLGGFNEFTKLVPRRVKNAAHAFSFS